MQCTRYVSISLDFLSLLLKLDHNNNYHSFSFFNSKDYGTAEIADHSIALALSLRRGIPFHHDLQRQPYVKPWMAVDTPLVSRLHSKTFGIFGLGRIGTAVALRAKAFGWRVIFYDPYVPNGVDKMLAVERVRDVKELFRRSSTLSINSSCTQETRGMITWNLIGQMSPGSVLVNTARGEIVCMDAVERGLREGILAGAGLDVVPLEPIPDDNVHPLIQAYRNKEEWLLGRLVITPHSAYYCPESVAEIRSKSAQTIRDVLIDGIASNIIHPEDS